MAKSIEQRTKELVDSNMRAYLVKNWATVAAACGKDLNAPIFKKQGDIAGLAKRYDTAADNFISFAKKKADAKKLFDAAGASIQKSNTTGVGLKKELDDIVKDATSGLVAIKADMKVEEILDSWEARLTAQQTLNKERKAIFDRMTRLGEEITKALTDGIATVRKEVAVSTAGLTSTNNEMNSLEAQIRSIDANYQKTAIDMDKKEIADEVRGFLSVF